MRLPLPDSILLHIYTLKHRSQAPRPSRTGGRPAPVARGSQQPFRVQLTVDPTKPIPAATLPPAFELALRRCGASERTVHQYRRHATHFVEVLRALDPTTVVDIRHLDKRTLLRYVERDLTGRQGRDRAASTRAVRINAVRSLLRGLEAAGALKNCGAWELVAPHLPPPPPPSVVPAHRRAAFFAALRGSGSAAERMTHVVGVLMLMTGLRVSEACALNVSDLSFHDSTASVHRKGGATQAIELAPELSALLYQYVTYVRPQLCGSRRAPDALFVTRVGRISVNEVDRRFREAGRSIGLPPNQCQPHRVRATAITMVAVRQGPVQAMTLANHKRLETTMRYVARNEISPAVVAAQQGAQAAALLGLPPLAPPALGTARSAQSAAAGLSPRQRQVFELVGQGRTAREIAASLSISHSTARRHMAELFSHLGGAAQTRELAQAEVTTSAAA